LAQFVDQDHLQAAWTGGKKFLHGQLPENKQRQKKGQPRRLPFMQLF